MEQNEVYLPILPSSQSNGSVAREDQTRRAEVLRKEREAKVRVETARWVVPPDPWAEF